MPRGLSGIWHRITGKYSKIRLQNEVESLKAWQRDRAEKDALISRQLTERHELQKAVQHFREQRAKDIGEIEKDIGEYLALKRSDLPRVKDFNEKSGARTRTVPGLEAATRDSMARSSPHKNDGVTNMTKTIRLTIDEGMTAMLEELADFHGQNMEDTIRLLIRYDHANMRRFAEEEFGLNGEKAPPTGPQPDDEIPM